MCNLFIKTKIGTIGNLFVKIIKGKDGNLYIKTPQSKSKLSAPTGLSFAGNILYWNAVTDATSYDVYVDGNILLGNTTGTGSGEAWLLNKEPIYSSLEVLVDFKTGDNTEYQYIYTTNSALYYGNDDDELVAYNFSNKIWQKESMRVLNFNNSVTDTSLKGWLQTNGETKLFVDLSTFTGWGSLSDGAHIISIVAKSDGYENSEKAEISSGWTATVTNLGAQEPTTVVFDRSLNFPSSFEAIVKDTINFVKLPKMYRKINAVSDDQITSWTISNFKLDDSYKVYPCFLDENGNELDYILVAKDMSYFNTTFEAARTQAKAEGPGYQLMDWMIKRLYEDLVVLFYTKINVEISTSSIDKIGLNWGTKNQWIDGIARDDNGWIISYKPSSYASEPIANYNDYVITSYSSPATDGEIQKLGYDENNPFVNVPSAVITNTRYNTYYCDEYRYFSAGNHPVLCKVTSGLFYCNVGYPWTDTAYSNIGYRLCYRPVTEK